MRRKVSGDYEIHLFTFREPIRGESVPFTPITSRALSVPPARVQSASGELLKEESAYLHPRQSAFLS